MIYLNRGTIIITVEHQNTVGQRAINCLRPLFYNSSINNYAVRCVFILGYSKTNLNKRSSATRVPPIDK